MPLTIFKYLFLFQRYSSFKNVQISQVMMSSTQPYFDQIWWKRYMYLGQVVSEMFDSLQQDCTKYVPQYKLYTLVTMATYWVPDLPCIKGISGHLWRSIVIFSNGASCMIQQAYKYISLSLWPCLTVFKLKIITYWNQLSGDWKRVSCHGNRTF